MREEKRSNGKTLRFTPMSPPLRKNDDAKAWEEGQTYEKTLVALSRAVVNGQLPDVGEIWGDISSERGIVRSKSISCVLKNGKHVDMEFDGHVSYQGKGGVRGDTIN